MSDLPMVWDQVKIIVEGAGIIIVACSAAIAVAQ